MNSKEKVLVDHKELTLVDPEDKEPIYKNYTSDRIHDIEFIKCTKKRFLKGEYETERIIIHPSGMKAIIYDRDREKNSFEKYMEDLTRFAKENHISLHDELH